MRLGIWLTVAIVMATACATPPKQQLRPKIYTDKERKQMTFCIGVTDSVTYIATEKIRGASREKLITHYTGKPYEKMNVALVDKVYNEKFTSAWDYSIEVFGECAENIANVPKTRVRQASYCMQNQLIADVAYAYKKQGAPKEKAYAHFGKYNSDTPKRIVDRVYASTKSRGQIKLDVWNDCISVFSE